MAKHIESRPEFLKAERVADIYSISSHVSDDFADYINYWKHNGFWLFDSPEVIQQVAREHSLDLTTTQLLYFEVYELEFDEEEDGWKPFEPEASFTTQVIQPETKTLEGYDVATFSQRNSPECSPLPCNSLAEEVETNEHCLFVSLEQAKDVLEQGKFNNTEPGPYRIFAVYSVGWP